MTPCWCFWTASGYSSVGCPVHREDHWSCLPASCLVSHPAPIPICVSNVFQGEHLGSGSNHTDWGRCVWLCSCIRMENVLRVTHRESDWEVGELSEKWEGGQDRAQPLAPRSPFPLLVSSDLVKSLEVTIWTHCHFSQNNFDSESIRNQVGIRWSLIDVAALCLCGQKEDSNAIPWHLLLVNFPQNHTAWHPCNQFLWKLGGFCFFKHSYHSLAECLWILFTKKLVSLFDLAHVRSLIIFFFFSSLAVHISSRIKLCSGNPSWVLHIADGNSGWPGGSWGSGRPCVSDQVGKHLFN